MIGPVAMANLHQLLGTHDNYSNQNTLLSAVGLPLFSCRRERAERVTSVITTFTAGCGMYLALGAAALTQPSCRDT